MLVRDILKGISDELSIAAHLFHNSPVRDLVSKHNKIAVLNDSIAKIDDKSLGIDLKNALLKHEPEVQIKLLHGYVTAVESITANIENEVPTHVIDIPVCKITKLEESAINTVVEEAAEIKAEHVKEEHIKEEKAEEVNFKHYIVKVIAITVGIAALILLGAAFAIEWASGDVVRPDIKVVSEALSFFIELIKIFIE